MSYFDGMYGRLAEFCTEYFAPLTFVKPNFAPLTFGPPNFAPRTFAPIFTQIFQISFFPNIVKI
jgi:hypothetical protein